MGLPFSSKSSSSSLITGYTQTLPLLVSGSIQVPSDTKRIEAMLCGGGTKAFGGCQIYEIPLSGPQLTYVVGASGGGMSTVSCAGTVLAAVGGVFAAGGQGSISSTSSGSPGYPPFNTARMLWSALDFAPKTGVQPGSLISTVAPYPVVQLGMGGINDGTSSITAPCDAYLGWGGGGGQGGNAGAGNVGGSGGSGAPGGNAAGGAAAGGNGGAGAAGGQGGIQPGNPGGNGGSLTSISMWGLTGFGGGTGALGGPTQGAGGGGGMLGAGANGSGTTGGAGGLGGGGGNPGGAGFVMFRFYY